ncbi:MAG: hypothetical protein AMXMBFR84_02520 [Candidatus Hydrogenedentota bacterium]
MSDKLILAVDGGGTATRAALYSSDGQLIAEVSGSASNPVTQGVDRSIAVIAGLCRQLLQDQSGEVACLAAGLSGAGRSGLRGAVSRGLANALRLSRVVVTDDLRPMLHANLGSRSGILVISGTGSSVLGQTSDGRVLTVGGRGTLFGDYGSAFHIAQIALRAAADALDGLEERTTLEDALLQAANLVRFDDFVDWTQKADKETVANLAQVVGDTASKGDVVAKRCVEQAADALARQAAAAAHRLGLSGGLVILCHGGCFDYISGYFEAFETAAIRMHGSAIIQRSPVYGHRAVASMALADQLRPAIMEGVSEAAYVEQAGPSAPITSTDKQSFFDALNAEDMIERMLIGDRQVVNAVARQKRPIAALIDRIADSFQNGGRLIYAGAGTSGRLGVLDASECPPTFGVDPDRVIGLIAGGDTALRASIEGAEDNVDQGEADIESLNVDEQDVVVGIAASGTTPYTVAVLEHAKARGAFTALIHCSENVPTEADIVVALPTGAEIVGGSTRLKAGTATKLVLNMLSTCAMAIAGRVFEGYMVGVKPQNAKLKKRAVHIVATLCSCSTDEAQQALDQSGGRVDVAVIMGRKGIPADEASAILAKHNGNLRRALHAS